MSVKFFGQFLIERGVLSAGQLLAALEDQRGRNQRFGSYALQLGYLTPSDVQRIHQAQQGNDARFGEVAVRLGLLSAAQVDEILARQRQDHIMLGELLVERGDVGPDVLERELEAFREDQAPYAADGVALPDGLSVPKAAQAMIELTARMLPRVTDAPAKAGAAAWVDAAPDLPFQVHLAFTGQHTMRYGLALDAEAARRICDGLLGAGTADEGEDVVLDAVFEFVNVVCGSVMARLAQLGWMAEIHPPQRGFLDAEGRYCVAPVATDAGDIRVVLQGV